MNIKAKRDTRHAAHSKEHDVASTENLSYLKAHEIESAVKPAPTKASQIFAIFFAVILFCATIFPTQAWADDENLVDPRQLPDSSFIYDVTIKDLSTADSYYNDQTVQVVGEAVGEKIKADPEGAYYWVTLLSQDAASNISITVYMSAADAEKIDTYGRYNSEGSTVRVRGAFHLTCMHHEGLSDIHAEYVTVVSPGEQLDEAFDPHEFIPGGILVIVGLTMLFVFYRIRESRR